MFVSICFKIKISFDAGAVNEGLRFFLLAVLKCAGGD